MTTGKEIIEKGIDAFDPNDFKRVPVKTGRDIWANMEQIITVAKLMSAGDVGMPRHLRGRPGICHVIAAKAARAGMDPYALAMASYVVNDRLDYTSIAIHALIEAYSPLQHRLDAAYDGEGETRRCTIRGMFTNGDVREYQSPMLKDITPRNSPLWKSEPDQQLFYYAVRNWGRRWAAEIMLGVYDRDEPRSNFQDEGPNLAARLAETERSEEGHQNGHAAREIAQLIGSQQTIENEPENTPDTSGPEAVDALKPDDGAGTPSDAPKRTRGRRRAETDDLYDDTEK